MITFTLILQAIVAVLKFPEAMDNFIRLLSKTPEEKRQEILARIQKESDDLDRGSRPKWD